jgi:hypothetical protein
VAEAAVRQPARVRAQLSDVRLPERADTLVYGGVSLSW